MPTQNQRALFIGACLTRCVLDPADLGSLREPTPVQNVRQGSDANNGQLAVRKLLSQRAERRVGRGFLSVQGIKRPHEAEERSFHFCGQRGAPTRRTGRRLRLHHEGRQRDGSLRASGALGAAGPSASGVPGAIPAGQAERESVGIRITTYGTELRHGSRMVTGSGLPPLRPVFVLCGVVLSTTIGGRPEPPTVRC